MELSIFWQSYNKKALITNIKYIKLDFICYFLEKEFLRKRFEEMLFRSDVDDIDEA